MRVFGRVQSLHLLVRRSLRVCLLISVIGLSQSSAAAVEAGSPTIQHFEPFRTTVIGGRASTMTAGSDTQRRLEVAAFGQTFRLRVEENTQLAQVKAGRSPGLQLLRGALADKPTSWVRLSYTGAGIQGLIWDGKELYAVEPSAAIASMVATPLTLPEGSVIFRLADAQIPPGADLCGATSAQALSTNGLAAYQGVVSELSRTQIASATGTPTRGVEVSSLADAAFRSHYSSTTEAQDAVLVRLNNVDGIFSTQVGIRMLPSSLTIYDTDPSQLSSSTAADTLLDSVASLRASSSTLQATGLTHLFTGRDLDGNTVGIGFVNTLCGSRYAASLTESRTMGAWLESLIAAHEMGHNLGAIHDGEGVCASTPTTYLMAPQISGSSTFSQCSLDKFASTLPAAACLVPLAAANPQLPSDLGTTVTAAVTAFSWSVPVKNTGDLEATGVQVQVNFPLEVTILDNWIAGGSCVGTMGQSTCNIDRLSAGETRTMNLSLSAANTGTYTVNAAVSATSDSNPNDNVGFGTIAVRPVADVAVSLGAPAGIVINADSTLDFTLANQGPSAATTVTAKLTYPADLSITAIDLTGAGCVTASLQTTCTLPTLVAGARVNGMIHFRATATGAKPLQLAANSDNYDPENTNNNATANLQIGAAAAATANSASGGGGGALQWTLLAMLLALRVARCRVR